MRSPSLAETAASQEHERATHGRPYGSMGAFASPRTGIGRPGRACPVATKGLIRLRPLGESTFPVATGKAFGVA